MSKHTQGRPAHAKSPDRRPARDRYWKTKTLQKHKVRNIMRNDPSLSAREALDLWQAARGTRRMRT